MDLRDMSINNPARRDKKTKEIVTIIETRYGGTSDTTITFINGKGVEHTLSQKEFEKRFEPVQVDLEYLIPYILQAREVNYQIRNVVDSLARKCTPGYYNVGDLVFICNIDLGATSIFGDKVPISDLKYRYAYLSRIAFRIIEITEMFGEPGGYWLKLCVCNKGKDGWTDGSEVISAPLYKFRLFREDASNYLRRYDKEF